MIIRFHHCFALLFLLGFPGVSLGSESSISVDADFQTIETLSYATLKISNKGERPVRVDRVTMKYGCISGSVEVVDHEVHVTIAPATTFDLEPTVVCAAMRGANAYKLIAINDGSDVISDGEDLYYRVQCGDGLQVYVTLNWKTKNKKRGHGFYQYTTASGENGTLSGKIVDDGSFFQLVCSPSPPPFASAFAKAQEFVREKLLTDKDAPAVMPRNAVPTGTGG